MHRAVIRGLPYAFVLALLLSQRGMAAEVEGVTANEIKIGNHSLQTGPAAVYGVFQRTAKAYIDMINDKGGVNGRKINFMVGDSGGNAQQALQVIKKQVDDDHVFAVAGCGPTHQAVYRYLRQHGVPDLWIADPNSKDYVTPAVATTFAFSPNFAFEAQMFAEFALKHFANKKVGILYKDDGGGKEALTTFKAAVGDKIKVVSEQAADIRGDASAKAQILNLKSSGAEVVIGFVPNPVAPAAIKFAHEQGFRPQWLLTYSDAYRATTELAGKDAIEGALTWYYTYTDSESDTPAVKAHLAFMKKYAPNEKPSSGSLGGQAFAELLVETIRRAGKDPTRESLLKAAESIKDWKCSVCAVANSTSPEKHLFNTNVHMLVAHNGKWTPLKDK